MTRCRLATPEDDESLLALLRRSEEPSAVTIERNPNFFATLKHQGEEHRVAVSTDGEQLTGCVVRSLWRSFIGGTERRIGYIHCLRVDPQYRRGLTFARLARFFRELHDDGAVDSYAASLAPGSATSQFLASGRPLLPVLLPRGTLVTAALPLKRNSSPPPGVSEAVTPASVDFAQHTTEMRSSFDYLGPAANGKTWFTQQEQRISASLSLISGHPAQEVRIGHAGALNKLLLRLLARRPFSHPLARRVIAGEKLRLEYVSTLHCRNETGARVLFDAARSAPLDADALVVTLHTADPAFNALRAQRCRIGYNTTLYLGGYDHETRPSVDERRALRISAAAL